MKGVSGYQLTIIVTLIVGVAILAYLLIFSKSGTGPMFNVFGDLINAFQSTFCAMLGGLGKLVVGGVC